ncbi:16S rRNA (cytidine(1402)-2'-O)-methyltransferase [Prochlorococcus marinus str. MU1404]|uniref:16S rRNA (cytidine(1402)-2'-O)-methyltransferase n=1 Tax=Prochlorococcus marinus TaxID=1219 RepID=UPI001AD9EC53|nr:16S rRNA (cytidine(1402)-2'-O)-methyltransferase [Prochlorococcus marinus]MBO8230518.1 16S rRNA (cytidine(1402)-2'-O)-methyltransferase [Prochlorococcus marinus XMU1404]MBW3073564.1 16S rRNA (cytidine(1402)-2'-O)-methyltransferase [Prochlorococcus marinus str. MU1404]MCR8545148.1 16S rRNA (cytidine(1402)-2'-O)-methyltransferase [Prochlorococcus marinus CUG1432]
MNVYSSFSHRREEPESGVLYLVGTPIGNLNDISFRAINILKNVSLIACEDTRKTKILTSRYEISNKLISFNKHNSINRITQIVNYLKEGKSVALVSDAGLPSICDPGEDLVKIAKKNNCETICIPGPSAPLTALVSSGFNSSKFIFEGFLPKKKIEREKILVEISKNKKTTIIFESPHRFNKLLKELKEYCGGQREISVSRELTKKFEEQINNNIDNIIDVFNNRKVIGEITIVIKGLEKSNQLELNKFELKNELEELINAGLSLSAASKYLAKKKNLRKNLIYNLY